MSYESLKESIAEAIRPNGNQEITGQILQDVLLNILDEAAASDKNIVDKINKGFEDANQALQALVGKKADKEGTYPKMSVGFAQEIVGDGSATEEEFSFRPTAGEDRNVANTTYYDGERNGVARIEKIKGNSLVYNQLVPNSDFREGTSGWRYYALSNSQVSSEVEEGIYTMTSNVEIGYWGLRTPPMSTINVGHKILIESIFLVSVDGQSTIRVIPIYANNSEYAAENVPTNQWLYRAHIAEVTNENSPEFGIRIIPNSKGTIKCNLLKVTDLTRMFRAGNEPTTVEEFWARIPEGVDINAYNEGILIDGNYGGINTVGFNAFNGTYAKVCGGCPYYLGGSYTSLGFATEEGGTTETIAIPTSTESVGTTPSDRLYTPSQNGYIYAEGENININISWDTEYGYLNGTYQPYKPFERDISWVAQYFPNGMRSAGSVRDEVRFNSSTQKWEAVQRVGVVDLGTIPLTFSSGNTFKSSASVWVSDVKAPTATENIATCSRYLSTTQNGFSNSNNCISIFALKRLWLTDVNFTDATALQAALQGVMLNYGLAEPIVTEIEEMPNMDFDVSDYGTEELIAQEGKASAPIVADITYAPNALSTLKQVPDILARLKALETAVASATLTTNMEE